MSSPILNRESFSYDQEYDCYEGIVEVGGVTYEGSVKSWDGHMEKAWDKAARIFEFIEKHFDQIEEAVRRDFIPEIRHWAEEQEEEGYSDKRLGDLTLDAMKTNPVQFRIYAEWISDVSYTGPRFLLGHRVNVHFDEEGMLSNIGLEG